MKNIEEQVVKDTTLDYDFILETIKFSNLVIELCDKELEINLKLIAVGDYE